MQLKNAIPNVQFVYNQPQIVRIKFWKLFHVILKLQKENEKNSFWSNPKKYNYQD